MASAFAHAVAGAALWPCFRTARAPRAIWAVGATLAVLPDIDVIGFRMGIPYGALLGHRGLTHALSTAVIVGALAGLGLTRAYARRERVAVVAYLVLAMATHGLLDAMTTGGLGVALLAPFDDTRYFFPWRPIAVSPIGVRPFFSARGVLVLANEAKWVGVPALAIALLGTLLRHARAGRIRNTEAS